MESDDTNPTHTPILSGPLPSRGELFKLLTEEINEINAREKLRGWTPWVLLASLFSASWILVQDFFAKTYSEVGSLAAFVFMTITIMLARALYVLISERRTSTTNIPFSLLNFESTPATTLVSTAWNILILSSLYAFLPHTPHWIIVAALMSFYGLLIPIGLFIAALLAARFPLPIPHMQRRPGPVLKFAILLVPLVLHLLVLYDITLSDPVRTIQLIDVRIGALLALWFYGLTLFARRPAHSIVRDTLLEIRRELILQALPVDEAQSRTRVALLGAYFADIVRDDTRSLLAYISQARAEYEEAFRQIASFRASRAIEDNSTGEPPGFIALALSGTFDALKSHESHVRTISVAYHDRFRRLRSYLKAMVKAGNVPSDQSDSVIAEILKAQGTVDRLQKRFITEYLELQEVWNNWFPNDQRTHHPFGVAPHHLADLQQDRREHHT